MQRALGFTDTTIGKKAIMALSGTILFGFTIGHLVGNLSAFPFVGGANKYNEYAFFLRNTPVLLWGTRIALLVAFVPHIAAAMELWQRNAKAREDRYRRPLQSQATNFAAKTMYLTGPMLLFFVLFHLAHLTLGGMIFGESELFGLEGYVFDEGNPYNNMVKGFTFMPVVLPYILGVCALGMHLFHGVFSMLQTFGLSHPKYNAFRRMLATAIALFLTVGNLSFPISAWLSDRYDNIKILEPSVGQNELHHLSDQHLNINQQLDFGA